MTFGFNLINRRCWVSVHPEQFVAFGVQHGGHGQTGLFVWFWRWRVWIRIT